MFGRSAGVGLQANYQYQANWEAKHGKGFVKNGTTAQLFEDGASCGADWDWFNEPPIDPRENLLARRKYSRALLEHNISRFNTAKDQAIQQAEWARGGFNMAPPSPKLVKEQLDAIKDRIAHHRRVLASIESQLSSLGFRDDEQIAREREQVMRQRNEDISRIRDQIESITLEDVPDYGDELEDMRQVDLERQEDAKAEREQANELQQQNAAMNEIVSAALK